MRVRQGWAQNPHMIEANTSRGHTCEDAPMESGCEFCKIISGKSSARIVNESEHTLAFFPMRPAALGHTLVVPKAHVPGIYELAEPTAAYVTDAVLAGARALRRALQPDGLNIINSTGAAASQSIFHLHVHLVPRWHGDHIGNIWPPSEPWLDSLKDDVTDVVRDEWDGLT